MLLTITYTGEKTQELGYLLHKNPYRAQQFGLSFGKAYVFYPEVSNARTTMALVLDIDPVDLAKGKPGSGTRGLFDYVNDRPYVASSFMCTALTKVFATAMHGRCDKRQVLADTPLNLSATIFSLPCRGLPEFAREVFEPLGYQVSYETRVLDEEFPEWGDSSYIDLTIAGTVRLAELLNHLYVLIPVFDKQKHYWVTEDEIDKLFNHGKEWIADHPEKKRIVHRYFAKQKRFAYHALDLLAEMETPEEVLDEEIEETPEDITNKERRLSLNTRRLEAVRNAVIESGATSVIDIGCGEGRLLKLLLDEPQIKRLTGADVSVSALEKAKARLRYDKLPEARRSRITLMQASLTYRDQRFEGYDAICLVEVIEHLDQLRIPAFERVIFEFAAPQTVVLTTPNREYNANYEWVQDRLRHDDHRFEWTREEFNSWAAHICKTYGYQVEIRQIGDLDENVGTPTQMGVFTKCV